MVFPGMNVLWSPLLKLALIRLREGVADDDPLRLTAAGVLARDLPCGRAAASKLVETLHGLGWVDEQGWPTREET